MESNAIVVADSEGPSGTRLTTFLLHYIHPATGEPASRVVTATDWASFFTRRLGLYGESLARSMWRAYGESAPRSLGVGEWHLPFVTPRHREKILRYVQECEPGIGVSDAALRGLEHLKMLSAAIVSTPAQQVAAARGGLGDTTTNATILNLLDIADRLLAVADFQSFEHVAQAMATPECRGHYAGWRPYRPYQERR